MVRLRIIELSERNTESLLLKVLVGEPEFRHLRGHTDHICMFAIQTVKYPSKITKTGARHSHSKWFLLTTKVKSKSEKHEMDFNSVKAGFVEYKDSMFFIFKVEKKGMDLKTNQVSKDQR